MENIELEKVYNYFDNGKIRESRRYDVRITEVVPFEEIDPETLQLWEEEKEDCPWLYAPKTDLFLKGTIDIPGWPNEEIVFVRTIDQRWFSLGLWGGVLDHTEELSKRLTISKEG